MVGVSLLLKRDSVRPSLGTRIARLTDPRRFRALDVRPRDDDLSFLAHSVDEFAAQRVDLAVQDPAVI